MSKLNYCMVFSQTLLRETIPQNTFIHDVAPNNYLGYMSNANNKSRRKQKLNYTTVFSYG